MSDNANIMSASPLNEVEPKAGSAMVPVWVIVTLLVFVFGGGLYFDTYGGWFEQQVYAPYQSMNQLSLFQPASDADRAMQRGKVVYEQICGQCHGTDGMGKPGQAPPFSGSEWVLADNTARLIRIPLQGLNGPVQVKGVNWALAMPAMGSALPDEDLAAVLTYMRNSWGNKAPEITPGDVAAIRAATAGRSQPWTAAELEALK